jgi:hypothetical protein
MTLMFRLNDGDEHDGSTPSDATNAAHVSRPRYQRSGRRSRDHPRTILALLAHQLGLDDVAHRLARVASGLRFDRPVKASPFPAVRIETRQVTRHFVAPDIRFSDAIPGKEEPLTMNRARIQEGDVFGIQLARCRAMTGASKTVAWRMR